MITSKQRAFLRSKGQTLEPIFQIGKQGVTPDVIAALDQALEARELIKITVLENCEELDGDAYAICDRICARTHAEPVQVIGRKMVIYRKAEKPKIELPKASKATGKK